MIVVQIAGRIYRLRIGTKTSDFSYEEIPLEWINSPVLPQAWMVETVGSLVIQDGQSVPIIYDGSTARRSDVAENEVPLGRMMAYGNGRLWVAINTNEVVAGDIKTREFQSELKFTETQYFQGGGAFYFPTALTALSFVPASGAAGYGSLAVFGLNRTDMVRADIAYRDLWAQMPGFIQPLLLNTGAIGQFSVMEVNQDLIWRDGDGGIRSIRTAVADETSGPGLTPMSREVSRITDFESAHRLSNCSSIYLNNRALITASPFINQYGKTSFRKIISLDFSPVSSLKGKSPASYDGEWNGLLFDRLVSGKFNGTLRGFAISTDYDGHNRLWEITDTGESDQYYGCAGTAQFTDVQVPMVAEYPARSWGDPKQKKLLQRCDVFVSDVQGEAQLGVYFRADNFQKWTLWDTVEMCAKTTDPSTESPHLWKNLYGQERPQIKTYSITDEANPVTDFALKTGFEFQIRLALIGKAKINKVAVYASPLLEGQFADRGDDFDACRYNDVTGNNINYTLPVIGCNAGTAYLECDPDGSLTNLFFLTGGDTTGSWTIESVPPGVDPGDVVMADPSAANLFFTLPDLGEYVFRFTNSIGQTTDYPVVFACETCYPFDPYPDTPDFDLLQDHTIYAGTSVYGLEGVGELAEDAVPYVSSLRNWEICPYIDYCDGPEIENVTQAERYSTRWKIIADSGEAALEYGISGQTLSPVPSDLLSGIDLSDIFAASLSFDANARAAFALQDTAGTITIRRYVAAVPTSYTFSGDWPRLLFDGILQRDSASVDLVCFYVRDGEIKMRFQRDDFLTEYDFVVDSPTPVRVTKIDRVNYYQYTYYTDSLGQYRLARSNPYPPFPVFEEDDVENSGSPAGGEYTLGVVDGGAYSEEALNSAAPSGGSYDSNVITTGPYLDYAENSASPSGGVYLSSIVTGGTYSDPATSSASPSGGDYVLTSTNGGTYTENTTNSASPSGGAYA